MNFPGVIFNDEEVTKKIVAAKNADIIIDGHAPGLSGNELNAYVAAGIKTDHECSTVEEMIEKNQFRYVYSIEARFCLSQSAHPAKRGNSSKQPTLSAVF
uniref:hypothetical protein n=1 Tax=Clostridium sp. NkU-1 TaxID=1095009 RepID=UPI0032612F2C